MISFMEFVNKVENAKPPILKNYKKRIRLSGLQILGFLLLVLFSVLISVLIYGCFQEENCEIFSPDSFGGIFAFLSIYIGGIVGFIYSLKYSFKQQKKEFKYNSPTKLVDAIVVILGIIVLFFIFSLDLPHYGEKLNIIQEGLLALEVLAIVWYFGHPQRKRKIIQGKKNIPIYRILSLLGIEQDIKNPSFLSLHLEQNSLSFGYQDLTEKFGDGYYETYRLGYKRPRSDIYEGVVFKLFDNGFDDFKLKELQKSLQKFIQSSTGQDLFFHPSIINAEVENKNGIVTFYFITYRGTGAKLPNFYQDKYFNYTREDLDTIYKDVQTLMNGLDSRY
ncbi:MAG: hypothetical protein SPL08_03130 [Pseudomonadota bacterium]|nr:hypothetical protein [Pseudomonadota bacterium]